MAIYCQSINGTINVAQSLDYSIQGTLSVSVAEPALVIRANYFADTSKSYTAPDEGLPVNFLTDNGYANEDEFLADRPGFGDMTEYYDYAGYADEVDFLAAMSSGETVYEDMESFLEDQGFTSTTYWLVYQYCRSRGFPSTQSYLSSQGHGSVKDILEGCGVTYEGQLS